MKLGEWRERFSRQFRQYIDELSEFGVDTAQGIFDTAPPEFGNGGVTVEREFDGGTDFIIRASGHDAAFLEFGTGVETAVTRATVQSDFPIEPGSWSAETEGEFSKKGYWHYNGAKLSGTPPLGAMQDTCSEMQNWSNTIARRIFG